MAQNLTTQDGVLSRYQGDEVPVEQAHLQELAQRVQWLEKQPIDKQQVHIVDREGDAVEWLRACPKSLWLIRCHKTSRVRFEGKSDKIQELAKQLTATPHTREGRYKGKTAYQRIACALSRSPVPRNPNAKPPTLSSIASLTRTGHSWQNGTYSAMHLLPPKPSRRGTTGGGKSNASSNCSNNKVYNWKTGNKKSF
jgi:hypothetical protein